MPVFNHGRLEFVLEQNSERICANVAADTNASGNLNFFGAPEPITTGDRSIGVFRNGVKIAP